MTLPPMDIEEFYEEFHLMKEDYIWFLEAIAPFFDKMYGNIYEYDEYDENEDENEDEEEYDKSDEE